MIISLLHTHTLALIRSYTVYVKTYSCAIKGVLMMEGLFHLRKIMVRHCFYLDLLQKTALKLNRVVCFGQLQQFVYSKRQISFSRTTEQQQRFHEICSNLVKTRRRAVGWWKRLFTLKEEKPKMYFMTMIVSLAAVAWVGQQVHNLLLTYLIVTSLLLLPGLNQHGIISKYIGMAKREINKLLKQKEKKNE